VNKNHYANPAKAGLAFESSFVFYSLHSVDL
jgi:hypothetical protein